MTKKLISIVTPCFNEEANVAELHRQTAEVMASLPHYDYEHIFVDNASKDRTVAILKELASRDRRVKVIVNARNFGHIRSPYHGLLQSSGEAVILLVADLQDPPGMIRDFLAKWEEGFKVVLGIKTTSQESALMFAIRKAYYDFINRVSEIELNKNNTGFGLYDRTIIEVLRRIDDPYPYFRGLICDIGFESAKIPYDQPRRKRGITKNNFYTLYDMAMLGITNHSKLPLRVATMLGFAMSMLCFSIAILYLLAKLIFWDQFALGTAPLLIGVFLFSSVQLFFIGIIGEYIGAIHTQVLKRPLVIEKERIG
ncbi:MAG TPA: glycosyltransferase family 2 protein, partial [Bdellovibrionota bacterium]|nr:glycosyltransferase family 2 protein [Bdellovibrionota bacterium]